MQKNRTNRETGLTLVELLVIVGVLVLLAALLLPALAKAKAKSSRINCANNLKQVALAFRIWSGDNQDRYPMAVPVADGGTMEWVASGVVWRHFQVLSNELSTPKVVVCPGDERRCRTNFLSVAAGNTQPDFGDNTAVSYFVGVDSSEARPSMLLSGDRLITRDDKELPPGLHLLGAGEMIGWTKQIHRKETDSGKGNIALVGGSVQRVDAKGLRLLLKNSGVATNRLAIP